MRALLVWILGMAPLIAVPAMNAAQPEPARPAGNDVATVAAKIDELLAQRWSQARVQPAAPAGDAEFLRRVSLDLTGCIPAAAEARAFLEDKRPDRRQRLVEQLLASQRYINHFVNVWRARLIPEANTDSYVAFQQGDFEIWLKNQVAKNTPYDRFVRDLLVAPIEVIGEGGYQYGIAANKAHPQAFFAAKQYKPEMLAGSTARLFLGVSIECAQCHNHPYADWKRDQFWGFAAFFSGMRSKLRGDFVLAHRDQPKQYKLAIPGTDKIIQAKFLDDQEPTWKVEDTNRGKLADWVTAPANPFFSRAAVNAMWAYFLGTGLVEPFDDMVSRSASVSSPEVLELLAREFVAHQFDIKFLMRVLVSTRAYQLSSAGDLRQVAAVKGEVQDVPALFNRMPLRGLTGEQLFDSLAMATGYRYTRGKNEVAAMYMNGQKSSRLDFVRKFANLTTRPTEIQTSILQALSLMNGNVIADATSLQRSETLAAIVNAPSLTTSGRIEVLYLATLTRLPNSKELSRTVRFVQDAAARAAAGGAGADGQDTAASNALADVLWALLNSPEFFLNH